MSALSTENMKATKGSDMGRKSLTFVLLASAALFTLGGVGNSSSLAAGDVPVVADAISGVVASANGPEAGVWVIAVTKDLATRFIKVVVTDDQGRYLLPELPKANYDVWVRGYGLVDSKPVKATPGHQANLTAVLAPNGQAAAQYYPPNYWYALLHPPAKNEFPGTGPQGNGIAPVMKTQDDWVIQMKDGCQLCHQLGDKATRELADNNLEGWAERLKKARAAGDPGIEDHGPGASINMQNNMVRYGPRGLQMYADWTQRIAKGEYPTEAPPRPSGVERNLVLTEWDWAHGRTIHDEVATDRRNPTVNGNGPVFGVAVLAGAFEVFDPKTGKTEEVGYSVTPGQGASTDKHDVNAYPHNPMVDDKGRLWATDLGSIFVPPNTTARVKRPDFCSDTANGFAKYYPQAGEARSTILVYDPKTKKLDGIPSCYGIHHLMFGYGDKNTLYFSGDPNVVGWLDVKTWDSTHDSQKAMGWCPLVLDTKEKGVTKVALGAKGDVAITPDRTQWNQPKQNGPATEEAAPGRDSGAAAQTDPTKDTRISGFLYGVDSNPKDGSMWYAKTSPAYPTGIVRFERGARPPETCKTEYYEPPRRPDGSYVAFNGRGVSIDSNGVAWVAYGSGQFASFDRGKCKVMNGPTATGQHCPEGWKFYEIPGPKMPGTDNIGADWHYLDWVDRYNTLGLGKDIPVATGTNSDSLVAVMPGGKVIHLRVPYPMGFYAHGLDGRIDDPKAGWKGRGIWSNHSELAVWHQEGGLDGEGPEIVHFQMRPDPLAH